MPTSFEINGKVGRIILTGKFDFSVQDDFRQVIDEALNSENIKDITVDLENVIFMDSSAIGLLLLLNERSAADGKSLTLINCHDPIREIFAIGGFDRILTIQ